MTRKWTGPLAIENEQTGDGRVIARGALEWDDGQHPLAWAVDGVQHVDMISTAPQVGTIDRIWRDGDTVMGEGTLDDGLAEGAEMIRRMEDGTASHGHRQGLSIDPDNYQVQVLAPPEEDEGEQLMLVASGTGPFPDDLFVEPLVAAAGDPDPGDDGDLEVMFEDGVGDIIQRFTRLRIRGVTAVAVPAFSGAFMELVDVRAEPTTADDTGDLVSTGVNLVDSGPRAQFIINTTDSTWTEPTLTWTASHTLGRDPQPTARAFHIPEPQLGDTGMVDVYGMPAQELMIEQPDGSLAVPFTINDDRQVFGHAARWGQCHIGYGESCVTAPASETGYAHFHHGSVRCDDGTSVATGPLTMGCDHAAVNLSTPGARDHYANTGLAFADVRATNGALGVWVSGVLRPGVTDDQVRILRASSLSGDWRKEQVGNTTNFEFIGALAVNVPGFPIVREALTAAGVGAMPQAAVTATGGFTDGVQTALTAAGIVHRCPTCQQQALASLGYGPPETPVSWEADETLRLLRTLEMRTRHLRGAAAEHAMGQIRPRR